MKLSKSFRKFCKVVLFLPRFLFIFPFDYRFKFQKTLFRCSIIIFLVCTIIGFSVITKAYLECHEIPHSHAEKTFKFTLGLLNFLAFVVSYSFFLLNKKKVENIFSEIARIEYLLLSEKIQIKYSYWRTVIIDSVISILLILFIFFYIRIERELESCYFFAAMMCEFVPALLSCMIGKPFKLFLYISSHYSGLILKGLAINSQGISSSKVKNIDHLIVIHSSVYSFCKQINNCYSNYSLGLSLVVFLTISKVIISLITLVFFGGSTIEAFVSSCCYGFVWIIQFMDIIITCEKAAKMSNCFNLNLHSLFLDDTTGLISENEKILNHLQKNNCVQFTAADFFNLDFKLLHNMLASATTYLVLVFQFISLTELPPAKITCEPPNCIDEY